MTDKKLNSVYTSSRMKQRYEVWFLRCGLADGSGAWWFRYLVMNLGLGNRSGPPTVQPAQVWATWFPRAGEPLSWIQGYTLEQLSLSRRKTLPFHCHIAENGIEEGRCWGNLQLDGHRIFWNLKLASQFGTVLSNKGWIGFSKSPHSDATFSGEIQLDGQRFAGELLGFGVQGHNCGYRHRSYWRWMHAYFADRNASAQENGRPQKAGATNATTLEALVYDLPLGLTFRKVILWHGGKPTILMKMNELEMLSEPGRLKWVFTGTAANGTHLEANIEGVAPEIHRLPYTKTDGSGTFPVGNASCARATLKIQIAETEAILYADGGAVLEMGGV